MTENPNIEINTFILCAAYRKEPIFDSYKALCELEENREIDYVDFEWKYYQYYHRNRDLTIERSPENSSNLTFSNLPMDVLEKVVNKLDLVNCLVLRKVSSNLRRLVDSSELHCEQFYFHYGDRSSTIEIDRLPLTYSHTVDGGCEVVSDRDQIIKEYKDNRNFEEVMLADVLSFLKNPRLKIGRFDFIIYEDDACLRLLEFFKSLNFQLNVRSANIDTGRALVIMVLDCLKAETLEEITFDAYRLSIDEFNAIAETAQWKGAAKFDSRRFRDAAARMEKMLHFKEIRINNIEFSDENITMVRDVLLKSTRLESCFIGIEEFNWNHYYDDYDEFYDEDDETMEDDIIRIFSQDPAFDSDTLRFSIRNSRHHFQLAFERHYGTAMRIRRIVDDS